MLLLLMPFCCGGVVADGPRGECPRLLGWWSLPPNMLLQCCVLHDAVAVGDDGCCLLSADAEAEEEPARRRWSLNRLSADPGRMIFNDPPMKLPVRIHAASSCACEGAAEREQQAPPVVEVVAVLAEAAQ